MKKLFLLLFIPFALVSCAGNETQESESEPVTVEDEKELQEVQEVNVELEQLDGEIDSLLNTL